MSTITLTSLTLIFGAFLSPILLPLVAERRCPGNEPSVLLRLVERTQIVVSVEVNHRGPYDFLVDTGAQITVLNTNLANELSLDTEGTTGVVGVGTRSDASWARAATLKVGVHSTSNLAVLVQDLSYLHALDRHLRGILGGNFLSQFDLFLDYEHGLLCLDSTGTMGRALKGNRTVFVATPHALEEAVLSMPPVIRAITKEPNRDEMLLLLDSGTNAPLLYKAKTSQVGRTITKVAVMARAIDGVEHGFAARPAKYLTIEGDKTREISFITPMGTAGDVPQVAFDGLLPTSLFNRIYISYSGHYAMIDPR